MNVTKKAAMAVGVGVLAVGAGLGVGSMAQAEETATPTPTASATPSATTSDTKGPRGGRHGFGADLAAGLATRLGIAEETVQSALDKARETLRGTDRSAGDRSAGDAALAKALATELKLDEAKVTEALTEIREEAQAERKAEFTTRLDAAVTAGTLTRAEADAVLKAAEAGVIGYGGGRR